MNNDDVQSQIQIAIKTAVNKDWEQAISINEEILKSLPDDIPTLNRLGIAFSMNGKPKDSEKTFKKVLSIDPKNLIAKNNIERLKVLKGAGLINPYIQNISFIEEPGKSKVVPLVSVGEPKVFSELNIGEPVEISPSKHKVKVCSQNKQFIGYLPDNISHRMLKLLDAGYKYKTSMKSVSQKNACVFIQEIYASKKLRGLPSFPLDQDALLPNLSAGESSETPPLEIFDPAISSEE